MTSLLKVKLNRRRDKVHIETAQRREGLKERELSKEQTGACSLEFQHREVTKEFNHNYSVL